MIIGLSAIAVYDLKIPDDRRRLRKYIPTLHMRDKVDELNAIAEQIEKEPMIGNVELDLYRKVKNINTKPIEFASRYYSVSLGEKRHANNLYSFVNDNFYRLPLAENSDSVVYALLEKYSYERQRNTRDSDVCLSLRRVLNKFIPGAIHQTDRALREILSKHETVTGTYYGDCLSDDSDSEAEEAFLELPSAKRDIKLKRAGRHRLLAESDKYQRAMDGEKKAPPIDFKLRPTIHRANDFNHRKVSADLKRVNEKLEASGELLPDFLDTLETKFFVAQYRGVHYTTRLWDVTTRRGHRIMDERQQPQYSSAVLESCGSTTYHDYLESVRTEPGFKEELRIASDSVATMLLFMQHSEAVSYKGFAYVSLFHLLQYWYSANYDSLPKKLQADLSKEDSLFRPFLLNSHRPLLSTADIPYHALKYAYGTKLYKGYEDQRLFPRWRGDGRAERPYSGKIYVSLHPLNDYTERNPSHVTSMYKKGLLKLSNIISSERETSFLGSMPADRVVFQHTAKYPSFRGEYKTVYEDKYGISQPMYNKLQSGFRKFPPHSEERLSLEKVLAEYLCAYQEVRMIDKARRKAEKSGAVLIYRDEDGKFSLYHPRTPHTANKSLYPIVMAKRALYELLSPNRTGQITVLSQTQLNAKLTVALPGETNAQREMEQVRFFTSKRTFANGEAVAPVITMVT